MTEGVQIGPSGASSRYDLVFRHVSRPTLRIVSPGEISLSIGGVVAIFMTTGWRLWQQSYSVCQIHNIAMIHEIVFDLVLVEIHSSTDRLYSIPSGFRGNKFEFRKSASCPHLFIFILMFVLLVLHRVSCQTIEYVYIGTAIS